MWKGICTSYFVVCAAISMDSFVTKWRASQLRYADSSGASFKSDMVSNCLVIVKQYIRSVSVEYEECSADKMTACVCAGRVHSNHNPIQSLSAARLRNVVVPIFPSAGSCVHRMDGLACLLVSKRDSVYRRCLSICIVSVSL